MNISLPAILKSFDLVINGVGNGGTVDEITLPKMVPTKTGYKAGKLNAELQVPMGYEPMETSFKLTGLGDILLSAEGICSLDGTRLQFKGHEKAISSCKSHSVQIYMRGSPKEWDPSTIKKGEINVSNHALDLTYFKFVRDGEVIIERDDLKGLFKIRGVDINEHQNTSLA